MPDPLRALGVSTYYQYSPYVDPTLWDVQLFLAGCCWSDPIVHASMRQASTGASAPGWVDGNVDPDIRLLRDGSLSPATLLKFRGRFQVGPAALEACDSHHCANATVMIAEPQPPHAAFRYACCVSIVSPCRGWRQRLVAPQGRRGQVAERLERSAKPIQPTLKGIGWRSKASLC